jgi:hypothetical protein
MCIIIAGPLDELANMEVSMKLAILGVLLTAVITASPTAFAQQSSG